MKLTSTSLSSESSSSSTALFFPLFPATVSSVMFPDQMYMVMDVHGGSNLSTCFLLLPPLLTSPTSFDIILDEGRKVVQVLSTMKERRGKGRRKRKSRNEGWTRPEIKSSHLRVISYLTAIHQSHLSSLIPLQSFGAYSTVNGVKAHHVLIVAQEICSRGYLIIEHSCSAFSRTSQALDIGQILYGTGAERRIKVRDLPRATCGSASLERR